MAARSGRAPPGAQIRESRPAGTERLISKTAIGSTQTDTAFPPFWQRRTDEALANIARHHWAKPGRIVGEP
jgi:hypothetical protein